LTDSIIVHGNCQAEIVWAMLDQAPTWREKPQLLYSRSYLHPTEGLSNLPEGAVEGCKVLFQQKGVDQEFPHLAELNPYAQVATFHSLNLLSLWPFTCVDPRNKSELPVFPYGRYPEGDRLILELLDKNDSSPAEVLQAYLNSDVIPAVLERLFEIESERLRAMDRQCDVKLGEYILDRFRADRLFWSHNHPTSLLLKRLALDLLDRVDLRDFMDVEATRGWMADRLDNYEDLSELQIPIHPKIAEHFGLQWYSPDYRYHYMKESYTFDEYTLRYIEFK
jgi:hypothetical protein